MRLFNPAVFGSPTFNVGTVTPPPAPGGGSRVRRPLKVTVEPADPDEAALLIAILRHRFRI